MLFGFDGFFWSFVEIIGFVSADDDVFYLFEGLVLFDHFLVVRTTLLMISGFDELGHLFVGFVDPAGVDILE